MFAARGFRVPALALVAAFALAFGVAGTPAPAHATLGLIDGVVEEVSGGPLDNLTVLLIDESTELVVGTTTTDSSGSYSFVPPTDLTDYLVVADGGDTYVDAISDDIDFDASFASSGEVPLLELERGRAITGIVLDAGTSTPLAGVLVAAQSVNTGDPYPVFPVPTDLTGVYSITVPLDDDYQLVALEENFDYDPQLWDHVNLTSIGIGCGCIIGDIVSVDNVWPPSGPITGIDFDLLGYDDWIWFSVLALRAPGGTDYPGVLIYLDKWNTTTSAWDPVDSHVTDSDGFADLFGFGDGDYRLRYSVGGVFKAILSYDDFGPGPFPLYDGGKNIRFFTLTTGCGCGGFSGLDVDLLFPAASTGGGGGGGGTGGTGTTSRPRTGSNAAPTPSATPTPTPTPTSSPTPSASPEPSQSATPDPGPADGVPADFTWLWWLIILLVLGIIITIIVMVRRR